MEIRRWLHWYEEHFTDGGPRADAPLRKGAVAVVIANPYAGRYSDELDELVEPSADLATALVDRCADLVGGDPQSYGKGAVVGTAGEQEHGVACLTTPFGDALRDRTGGIAWVPSNTKVGGPGTSIDIPLAYKGALFVREFYDTVTLHLAESPRPDELVVITAMANGGRLHERLGGLTLAEVSAHDGVR